MTTLEYNREYSKKYYQNPVNRLKRVWYNMIRRCTDPRTDMYYAYGKRGITVCSEWRDFNNFKNDMLPGYKKGLTLDRIDVNKGYSKENCRWATTLEQGQNTTLVKPVYLTYPSNSLVVIMACKTSLDVSFSYSNVPSYEYIAVVIDSTSSRLIRVLETNVI